MERVIESQSKTQKKHSTIQANADMLHLYGLHENISLYAWTVDTYYIQISNTYLTTAKKKHNWAKLKKTLKTANKRARQSSLLVTGKK